MAKIWHAIKTLRQKIQLHDAIKLLNYIYNFIFEQIFAYNVQTHYFGAMELVYENTNTRVAGVEITSKNKGSA